ncbi:hypothetical protein P872_13485 [Rhodonellum psychrophilum GCM71 = DSM 17998]|uniref:Molybdopterin-synthase adenylyltransferase n=2 Tax=Rhodonellum TaxID=336827 RepID=U5BWR0_9BACT|nr:MULTISPECIES: HesA/MoeB/ThiF family protein [Rhodonellum]ERM80332.1 hypothetical protein P872_13485 [Rhodonellum psychrophilum GCM71 = DSM 17998]SDZ58628.1 adenylyltransferase and sulfurtransferase [Rhodonellum ikkaensis]
MKDFERYTRQMILPGFGESTQQLLSDARVLVIGAGGLGCPALLYLVAAGVGTIGIVDFDTVELTNLHRQVLYSEEDLGQPKVMVAAKKLAVQNSQVKIVAIETRLTALNAEEIIAGYDIVLDGSDNFPTRYLANDACVLLGKPLVYGSIYRFEGQVAVFNLPDESGQKTNYRDLFPDPSETEGVLNCAEAGVIGILPGIIGGFMANETLKIITRIGSPLCNRLMTFNSLTSATYTMDLSANPKAAEFSPKTLEELSLMDYEIVCEVPGLKELAPEDLDRFFAENEEYRLLDVRESHEMPKLVGYPYFSIPLGSLLDRMEELRENKKILVFCQSGTRSAQAGQLILQNLEDASLYNLKGGINNLIAYQKSQEV